uniref:estradiol 17-beta-dehydrogenase 8-like n=1 Tax=Styela clava TaxID=7725 RepID=UPI0019396347|nr:estradiol 17-beta-dehydrogenase 8-like [Styela clava]
MKDFSRGITVFLMDYEKYFIVITCTDADGDKSKDFCCIVNVSSLVGTRNTPSFAGNSATKSGMIELTKCIASEYSKHKIRCKVVLPGTIGTPMLDVLAKDIVEHALVKRPMQRLGEPEETANVCLFLAFNESSYVNGACLEVTGGLHA